MLEKPDLEDESIVSRLWQAYAVSATDLLFLPLGADQATAVYKVDAVDGVTYFLKLRRGRFDVTSVTLPRILHDQGITNIIAPLFTVDKGLYASLNGYSMILYPYVDGVDGYQVVLSEQQWFDFGRALRQVHTVKLPARLHMQIRREMFTARWGDTVRQILKRVVNNDLPAQDSVGAQTAALMEARMNVTLDLVERADHLAAMLKTQATDFVLCHADVHAGNVLISTAGDLYIVDWDDPILAPKERDLMYIGGAQGFLGRTPDEEVALFYRGYGPAKVNPAGLAYYRYARIVEDIGIYCEQLLLSHEGGEDRVQSLEYLASNFETGGTIAVAYDSDALWRRL